MSHASRAAAQTFVISLHKSFSYSHEFFVALFHCMSLLMITRNNRFHVFRLSTLQVFISPTLRVVLCHPLYGHYDLIVTHSTGFYTITHSTGVYPVTTHSTGIYLIITHSTGMSALPYILLLSLDDVYGSPAGSICFPQRCNIITVVSDSHLMCVVNGHRLGATVSCPHLRTSNDHGCGLLICVRLCVLRVERVSPHSLITSVLPTLALAYLACK